MKVGVTLVPRSFASTLRMTGSDGRLRFCYASLQNPKTSRAADQHFLLPRELARAAISTRADRALHASRGAVDWHRSGALQGRQELVARSGHADVDSQPRTSRPG